MKSKKAILILIVILVVCLALVTGTYLHSIRQYPDYNENEVTLEFLPETVFSSDDFYFTFNNPANITEQGRGRSYFNNMLNFRAEIDIPKSQFEELAREHNARITSYRRSEMFGDEYTFTFERVLTIGELNELIEIFESLDFVSEVWVSRPMNLQPQIMNIPNDPYWRENWGLDTISAPMAWNYRDRMSEISVLVLDSGFYRNHEDLKTLMPLSIPFFVSRPFFHSHGTHVAGIIGAEFDNSKGVVGTAPNARMYGVEIASFCEKQLMNVIEWYVVNIGVRVANISMGWNLLDFASYRDNENALRELNRKTRFFEKRLQEIINVESRFVIVSTAGNQYEKNLDYTSRYLKYVECENSCEDCWGFYRYYDDFVGEDKAVFAGINGIFCPFARIQNPQVRERIIVVGAVRARNFDFAGSPTYGLNTFANFSQRGKHLDVTAPGVAIYSTLYGVNGYGNMTGTSMSAPFVSGLATMLFGINPDFSGAEVKQIIVETADGNNNYLINAYKAVRLAMEWDNNNDIDMEEPEYHFNDEPSTGNLHHEVIYEYMEFMRQETYLSYFSAYWDIWYLHIAEYAILDINGDGIPELVIRFTYATDWYVLIFSYDTAQQRVVYISEFYYVGLLQYSERYRAFVFQVLQGNDTEESFIFYAPDILSDGGLGFILMLLDGVYYINDEFYTIDEGRNISESEFLSYFEDIVEIEFSPIPTDMTTNNQPNTENIYDRVIDAYMQFLRQRRFEYYIHAPEWLWEHQIYYAFFDIDGNGVPELLIGIGGAYGNVGVFTWQSGRIYNLFPYEFFGERANFFVHSNGVIEVSGSGGAFTQGWRFYKISSNEHTLDLIDGVIRDGQLPTFIRGSFENGEIITETEFENIIMQHTGRMTPEPLGNSVAIEWRPLTSFEYGYRAANEILSREGYIELSNFMNENGFTLTGLDLEQILGREVNDNLSPPYTFVQRFISPSGMPFIFLEVTNELSPNDNVVQVRSMSFNQGTNLSIFYITPNDTLGVIERTLENQGFLQSAQITTRMQPRREFEKEGFIIRVRFGGHPDDLNSLSVPYGVDIINLIFYY